jgi:S1-C subfamily serine protease
MEPLPVLSIPPPPQKSKCFSTIMIVAFLLVGLVTGGLIGYAFTYSDFNTKLSSLQSQIGIYQDFNNKGSQQTYVLSDNKSLSSLYQQVKSSVVVVQDLVPQYSIFRGLSGYSLQQGSGFVTQVNNQLVIVTNNHVVQDSINVTVTFSNGNSYPAKVLGSDAKADLAVLTITPMPNGLTPLLLSVPTRYRSVNQ